MTGHVLEPRKLEPTAEEIARRIKAPQKFSVSVFARDLVNPRMLAVGEDGTVYATRRSVGDVVMMKDTNGDGTADETRSIASRSGMHGIAIDGRTAYLVTVNDVYTAPIRDDGSFGELQRIIDDLPAAGQHPNRTIAMGPDGKLYISVGSTCNACGETDPENATLVQAEPDGSSRRIFASGLRNTIGFDWHPETRVLYGMDHGIDWLGDNTQIEELNRIEEGRRYGWPYIYGMGEFNPQDDPPGDITLAQWAAASTQPLLGYTPHAAPMQMAFYDGDAFPPDYRGDAFIAMRGSWNRKPPSGHEVVRVRFGNGEPQSAEPFLTGFLSEEGGSYGYLGRLAGIAVAADGALLVADDSNGVIYRVAYQGPEQPEATSSVQAGASSAAPMRDQTAMFQDIALNVVDAKQSESLQVSSSAPAAGVDSDDPFGLWRECLAAPVLVRRPGGNALLRRRGGRSRRAGRQAVHPLGRLQHPGRHDLSARGVPTDPAIPLPEGAKQGVNSRGSTGNFGMKPPAPDGAHSYHFQVFALDKTLDLKPGATREDLLKAMQGHVLAKGEVVGTNDHQPN